MSQNNPQPPPLFAYRNAALLSIASGTLFFLIFGSIPGIVFGIIHFIGNLNSIKSSRTTTPIDTIPAMKITTNDDNNMTNDISNQDFSSESGIQDDCSSISTSTPKKSRKNSNVRKMLKGLKLRRISAIVTSPKK